MRSPRRLPEELTREQLRNIFPSCEWAWDNWCITREELLDVLTGKAYIQITPVGHHDWLKYWASYHDKKFASQVRIYPGRAEEIAIKELLGLDKT